MMASIIRTEHYMDKQMEDYEMPPEGERLEGLQGVVGGYIEALRLPDGRYLIINENGRMEGLPLNPLATTIATIAFEGAVMRIVGDVILCRRGEW